MLLDVIVVVIRLAVVPQGGNTGLVGRFRGQHQPYILLVVF